MAKRRPRREVRLEERRAAAAVVEPRPDADPGDAEHCETCGMPSPGSRPPCPTCENPMVDVTLAVCGVSNGDDWSEEGFVWWCSACKVPRSVFTLEVIEDPMRGNLDADYWAIVDGRREIYRSTS